ncbi:hypothetical protein X975_21918, partial [Stegodyphus mimosarum]
MALVLPSTVEELNLLQNSVDHRPTNMYVKASNQGFENIIVEKRFKREISLPNGVENWNISNYDSYLNFGDNLITHDFDVESADDRLVPEEGDQRQRCESFSSVSSTMDDKHSVFSSYGVKTINTVCMDSGSTCISSDHSYVSPPSYFKGLDAEETYQNLDVFLQQVPDIAVSDTLSSIPSPGHDSKYELHNFNSGFSLQGSCSQDSISSLGSTKRSIENPSEDDIFNLNTAKRLCETPDGGRYHEIRRKNNIASKNCRKTRKEKQKEMEIRVAELEKEKEGLNVEIQVLEEMIKA